MSSGPDGDDEPIELEPDLSGPVSDLDGEVEIEVLASAPELPLGLQQTALAEAAAADPAADVALYGAEARAQGVAGPRAVLLAEVAGLQERALADEEAALKAARAAFTADQANVAIFWLLRRLLARRAAHDELVAAYDAVLAAAPVAGADRADLMVERGRLLEDWLGRDADAAGSYREALGADPDHPAALLALYLLGVRAADTDAEEKALAGLARRAAPAGRRVALSAALARTQRERSQRVGAGASEGAAAAERALRTLEDALAALDVEAPLAPLLVELDALTRAAAYPEVSMRALEELGRRAAPIDAPLAAALLRERARLLRDRLHDPAGALQALEEAAQLSPAHPLVAIDLIDLADRLDRPELTASAVAAFGRAAPGTAHVERVVDLALRQAEALGRAGKPAAALAALAASPAGPGAWPDAEALRLALLARAGDVAGLAEAFEGEGSRLAGTAAAWAFVVAGTARRALSARDVAAPAAEALYRRALAAAPGYRPGLDALEALLRAEQRHADLAELWEGALAVIGDATARETGLREQLVRLYRDDLAAAERALVHQERLVALAPDDLRRRVRLRDLQLVAAEQPPTGEAAAREAETVLALARAAGEPMAAAALNTEAARLLAAAGDEPRRARAEALLRQAVLDDVSGLAGAALEEVLPDPTARAAVVAEELDSLVAHASGEVVRALRFRVAYHQAAAGRFAEAVATLTPLRAEGDALARAWSWDLARLSRDAILEVAVLSEEASGARGGATPIAAPADVLVSLGEALERAGDPAGAAEAFRKALREPAAAGGRAASPEAPAAVDAALGLLRVAASAPAPSPNALLEALQEVARASAADPRLATAAAREAALLRVAGGRVEADDVVAVTVAPGAPAVERAEAAVLRWSAGVRRGDSGVVAESLLEMARVMAPPGGSGPASSEVVPLLARAAARARLAGAATAEAVHGEAWRAARSGALAPALADLPVAPGEGWPADRPDPRRARAARVGGALGLTLDLEAALDAERRGALGAALAGYGRVIAADPDRLEAWEGIRRVARAGGDAVGEARALARLGTLIRTPAHAAALLSEAARLFEDAGRWDEAVALWGKALEARPDDEAAYQRLREVMTADPDGPGRPAAFDRLLSHRLTSVPLSDQQRVELLLERARHRLDRVGDTEGAVDDFKRVLNIDPQQFDALGELAHLAMALGEPAAAAPLLERFLAVARDERRAATARLDLAGCYEALGERARAIEVLRRAAALTPHDPTPVERLVDLHLRLGEWRSAVETLRGWEPRAGDARARAALHLRIGELLRDLGHDTTGAALSFRMAAELDPLGEGTRALVTLHEGLGDAAGALQTIEREVAQLRRALLEDPLDCPRLERLEEFLGALRGRSPAPAAAISDMAAAVAGVRALLTAGAGPAAPTSPVRPLAPRGAAFWAELAVPGALGFMAEIWPHLVDSAAALFPPPAALAVPREGRIPPGSDPRLSWIEATAAASGLPGLRLFVTATGGVAGTATAIEDAEPALVLDPSALKPEPAARFRIGRALGLLRDRATVLERITADELGPLFACAALMAGAAPPPGTPAPSEAMVRTVTRAMSRKDRKALTLQASRFGFETIDPARWRKAVLRTADRLGLLLAGDVAAAARVAAHADAPARGAIAPEALRGSGRALDLLRFALGEGYALLRRDGGLVT